MRQVFKSGRSRFPMTRTFAMGWVGMLGVAGVLEFQSEAETRPYLEMAEASPWAPHVTYATLGDAIREARQRLDVPQEFERSVAETGTDALQLAARARTFDVTPLQRSQPAPQLDLSGESLTPHGPEIQTAAGWTQRIAPVAAAPKMSPVFIECMAGCVTDDEKPHKLQASRPGDDVDTVVTESGMMEHSNLKLPCGIDCEEGETLMMFGPQTASPQHRPKATLATGAPGYVVLNTRKPAVSSVPMTATLSGAHTTVRPARNFRAATRFDHPAR